MLSKLLSLFLFFSSLHHAQASLDDPSFEPGLMRPVVKREERRSVVETEFGGVSAARVSDGTRPPYYLQFITLEPNTLFLPSLLHADMVFYVQTGSGRLSWANEEETRTLDIRRGDVYRLQPGSVFYIESNLEHAREKLRICAIFTNTEDQLYESAIGAYTSISDLVLGFDKRILQSAFKVSEDVIEEIFNATRPLPIVHALPKQKKALWAWEARFLKAFVGDIDRDAFGAVNGKKRKAKTYNILDADPDFQNCNGWSLTVDKGDLRLLKGSNIGLFMVNLTKGSMMGPHWNPMGTEIAMVLHGQGMVRVVCPSTDQKESDCKNMRFKVEEGDVFLVPRFHPMAQMSFNNDSFVFVGFSASIGKNYPQFLAGQRSVLQALDRQILSVSFNVSNTTINQLLAQQEESIILDCTSCAEEEESIMQEEIRREREEQEAKEREEERKREEEEARKREEEEARKREEEEARKREEEERERQEAEEARKREEEEARKREEEERERQEEEEARKREEEERERERERQEEEEARKREEEEARKREEEEARKREEEEARKREEEERERQRQEEEEEMRREEAAQREAEEARRQEEERQRRQREEQEEREREEGQEGEEEGEAGERQQEEQRRQEEEERQWGEEGEGVMRTRVKKSSDGNRVILTNVLKL